MKKVALLMLILLATASAHAEVPHYINLQSMIYDMDGNVTTSDMVSITVRILDADDNVLFTETHNNIPVVEGAVNLLIGSMGETGELPVDILDPSTGTKFLDVQVDGTAPFDLMPLTAVPYAMWAEKALTVADDSIESRHIKDGTIELRDLAPGITFSDITGEASEGQIPTSFTTDSELTAHIQASPAHPASAISLTGPFASFVATNVQTAIEKIDMKLSDEVINRRVAGGSTNRQLADEIIARTAADNTERDARISADSALQDNIAAEAGLRESEDDRVVADAASESVSLAGDTMTGPLIMQAGETTRADIVMDDEGLSEEEKLKVDGVDVSTLPDLIGTNNAGISDLQSRVSANESEILALDSRIDSNDSDIFNLQGQVSSHTTSISNLQSADNSLQGQITSNDTDISNLNTTLTNETNARTAADAALQINIDGVQSQVTSNDADITSLRSEKVAKAGDTMTGDLTMQADIVMDDEALPDENKYTIDGVDVSTLPDLIGTNNAGISDLQSRVSANDSEILALDSRIDLNDSDIFNLQGQVSSHTTSINTLNTGLASEESARILADNGLSGQIAGLNTGLANEANIRRDADIDLGGQINQERTDRQLADDEKVAKAGDTMTGELTVPSLRVDGNVGIGTTNPDGKLHIESIGGELGSPAVVLKGTTAGSYQSIDFYGGPNITGPDRFQVGQWDDGRAVLYNAGDQPIDFYTSSTPRVRIDANGDVGIGTTDPQHTLDVLGDIGVSGTVDGVDVSTLPGLIGANNTDISGLQSRVSANESEISILDSRIDLNDSDISNLQSQASSSSSHISATSAHGSNGAVVGMNTLTSSISTHSGTDIATAHLNGSLPTSRLSGEITSAQITDNSITTGDIQNGTISTSDMASSNISQWTNDSSYITDGNTGWDNTYGFITDGNTGWDNSYGFITDGNTNWGNEYGFITSSSNISGNAATATYATSADNADTVDGHHLDQDVSSTSTPFFKQLWIRNNNNDRFISFAGPSGYPEYGSINVASDNTLAFDIRQGGGIKFGGNIMGEYPEYMRIATNGNIGIGTPTPQENLHIHDANGGHVDMKLSTGSSGKYVYYGMNNTPYAAISVSDGTTTTTDALIVKPNGNVGIGTTSPDSKLKVCDGGACFYTERRAGNYGNDVYGGWIGGIVADTCDGNIGPEFNCGETERKYCTDARTVGGFPIPAWSYREVWCKLETRLFISYIDEILSP